MAAIAPSSTTTHANIQKHRGKECSPCIFPFPFFRKPLWVPQNTSTLNQRAMGLQQLVWTSHHLSLGLGLLSLSIVLVLYPNRTGILIARKEWWLLGKQPAFPASPSTYHWQVHQGFPAWTRAHSLLGEVPAPSPGIKCLIRNLADEVRFHQQNPVLFLHSSLLPFVIIHEFREVYD